MQVPFLATGMNDELLPLDHGAPVRLIVPGWYGCSNIKWVERIEVVRDEHPATSQMREFASRTHQNGRPELAREYIPATIDFAAMPVLIEGPDADGSYVVQGVAWGAPQGVETLLIRYAPDGAGEWLPVHDFEAQEPSSWTLWQHRFRPARSADYEITLRVGEGAVRARRLDRGYYARRARLLAG